MDYPRNRTEYIENYPQFYKLLKLTPSLIQSIRSFNPSLWKNIPTDQDPQEEVIKSWILLELTNTRESCDKLINILNDTGNNELVNLLQTFNTSPGRIQYWDEIDIDVVPMKTPNLKYSQDYPMTRSPRGKAIIINLVPNEVQYESFRFKHIFQEFKFEVMMPSCRSTAQIIEEMQKIQTEIVYQEKKDQALMVMIITHGIDNKIIGGNHTYLGGNDKNDIVDIDKIVNTFSNIGDDTVKLFFFTCCREISITKLSGINLAWHLLKEFVTNLFSTNDSKRNTNNTFVYYSCAEGYETPIENNSLYTPYGRALSESLAQFAHMSDMASIMNRTYNVMKVKYGFQRKNIGDVRPENNQRGTTHKLFFNPCWSSE